MFDCGEGTQRQMQRSLGLAQVDEIYLTHFHADHILGLPGLLKTYDLTDREVPLTIYGPPRPARPLQDPRPLVGRLDYELDLVELAPGEAVAPRRRTRSSPSRSTTACAPTATRWSRRPERPGRFDPEAAKRLGVAGRPRLRGPAARGGGRGQRRAPVRARGRVGGAAPGPHRRDHRRHRARPATVAAAADAELLIHDASFAEEEVQRAAETGHSTVGQAAAVAREAHVKLLALVHISSRYHVGKVLEEAQRGLRSQPSPPETSTSSRSPSRSGRPRARPKRSPGARRDR